MRILTLSPHEFSVKSVTAPTSTRGSVYIETSDLHALDYIRSHVAFVYRRYDPLQIPLDDYTALMTSKNPALLNPTSWGRVKRKGPYRGDLVWIQAASEHSCSYDLWLLPRVVPCHEDNKYLLPSPVEYHLLMGGVSTWTRTLFHEDLLVQLDVPLYAVVDDDASPTLLELEAYAASRAAESDAKVGDRVRVLEGPFIGLVGLVMNADEGKEVTVQLFAPTIFTIEVYRSSIVVDWDVGQLVEIVWGQHKGLTGWIVAIDWTRRTAHVVIHSYMPFTDLARNIDIGHHAQLPEYEVDISFLRSTTLKQTVIPPSVAKPTSDKKKNPKIGTQFSDPLKNIEVRIVKGHYRGTYGIIKSTFFTKNSTDVEWVNILPPGNARILKIKVFTEGCAVNETLTFEADDLRERHTNLELAEYVVTPPAVRSARRKERECSWAEAINPSLDESVMFADKALGDEAWTEIGITGADLWPQLYRTHQEDTSVEVQVPNGGTKQKTIDPTRSTTNFGAPGGQTPGTWLLEPKLRGLTLDVVIRNAETAHKVEGKTMQDALLLRLLGFPPFAPIAIKPVIERFPLNKVGVEGMVKLREGKMRYRGVLVVQRAAL
ncbi:hypothetical protein B0H19DRAFT_1366183 [Mycena capillaripes]|nr:hypothetical protein B0H19DRAFT_1366183 [Mycena capillaripes]